MASTINRYPLWKYILIIIVIAAAFLYAAPNLYPEIYAVQIISGSNAPHAVDEDTLNTAKGALQNAGITYVDAKLQDQSILFSFKTTDIQLKAKETIQQALGDNYLVALNLANTTPPWLKSMGGVPLKLGLDLRGGIHFLMQVDVDSVLKQRVEGDLRGIGQSLRDERIRYSGINRKSDNQVVIEFRAQDALDAAYSFVNRRYNEFTWV